MHPKLQRCPILFLFAYLGLGMRLSQWFNLRGISHEYLLNKQVTYTMDIAFSHFLLVLNDTSDFLFTRPFSTIFNIENSNLKSMENNALSTALSQIPPFVPVTLGDTLANPAGSGLSPGEKLEKTSSTGTSESDSTQVSSLGIDMLKKITTSREICSDSKEGVYASGNTEKFDTKDDKAASAEAKDTNEKKKVLQEIKITRVPLEHWRKIKKDRLATEQNTQPPPENSIAPVLDMGTSGRQHAPYRLAINYTYLLNALEACTRTLFTEEQNVLVRPFKYLVEFESDIREFLRKTEMSCDHADDELSRCSQEIVDHESKEAEVCTGEARAGKINRITEFMDQDMRDIFEVKQQIFTRNLKDIPFEHLWQLYKPGDVVFRPLQHEKRWEMISFIIDCIYFESDGIFIAPRPKRFVIPPFLRTRPIASLPLRYQLFGPEWEKSNQTSTPYANYRIDRAEVYGEVIVDQEVGVTPLKERCYKWSLKTGGGIIKTPTKAGRRETNDFFPKKNDGDWVTDVFDDSIFEEDRRHELLFTTDVVTSLLINSSTISDEHLMLLPPRLYGFSLLDHRWCALDISMLQPITSKDGQSDQPKLEGLILPDDHKTILQALITNQIGTPPETRNHINKIQDSFSMDVVPAKVILALQRTPRKINSMHFADWPIDEDVYSFWTRQTSSWLSENEVISKGTVWCPVGPKPNLFLRMLEYFSGVLILTTNRVGEFDEAFRSRTHICLYYPKLEEIFTKEIGRENIQRIQNKVKGIKRFADKHWKANLNRPSRWWNGRQIKNAFQTAIALARWDFHDMSNVAKLDRPLLKAEHFRRVARITALFDDYISKVYGMVDKDTYGVLAERDEFRNDNSPSAMSQPTMQKGYTGRPESVLRGTDYWSPPDISKPEDSEHSTYGSDSDHPDADDESKDDKQGEADAVAGDEANKIRQLELELEPVKLKQKKSRSAAGKACN
ncbi:hypothetical protein TSTA_013980 [Talaromyces stipitatus ATCC 10500]|uniref:ATPase AAA-type core domain-containing protein n=1 Tax=Talaromyces stipitatus (strain ATCC 10500 / CBS 375.48 / QM 6759 / NRRL 1006) TaxID=441959 RepID=B8MGR9_TALSN|nr:uncharacterized protein TSTA_013980 [Talaromyces stipitatus ATCC 10500]EED16300.1 hypothetical protein TSTA_013980 [Talaromyces stipitatus ATCC 10500]